MPEPHADVFGDGLEEEEIRIKTVSISDEEHEGLLGGDMNKIEPTNGPSSADSSICCRYSFCLLAVLCLCSVSFVLGTRYEALKHKLDLDSLDVLDLLDSLKPQASKDSRSPPLPAESSTKLTSRTSTTELTTTMTGAQELVSLETMEKALACMRLTNPEIEAAYPSDAEEHFEQIYNNVTKFVPMDWKPHNWAHYGGPWIENHWIKLGKRYLAKRADGTKLKDIFGPFIPIFVPWVDLAVKSKSYPGGMVKMLAESMRKDVLYITVSQHDNGVFLGSRTKIDREKYMPNLLVLSSGGNGHVALPLLKQVEQPLPWMPMSSRRYFASFVGSANMFNRRVRKPLKAISEKWNNKSNREVLVHLGSLPNWKGIMENSSLIFVPRGFGRNSFRCGEVLQMGRIPIYVWDDIPWTFYPNFWEQEIIGFSARITTVEQTLDHIAKNVSLEQLERMEKRILSMRDTHFTYEGVIDQITKFMTGRDGGSDLRCTVYPKSQKRQGKRPHLRRLQRWLDWVLVF